jgi:hypothetical protein
MGLEFQFAKIEEEIQSFVTLARSFLDPTAETILRSWLEQLNGIRKAQDGAIRPWSISQARPVRTVLSTPSHNARNPHLLGQLSMVWELQIPTGVRREKGNRSPYFILSRLASTRISLWSNAETVGLFEVARWSFEIGDDQSPGCHFHVQVKAEENDRLFPPTLSVPRLPGIFVTPIDALDFLLGEIFQDTWRQHISRDTDPLRTWATIQRERMVKLFDWHQSEIRNVLGAPWIRLKHAKPTQKQLC